MLRVSAAALVVISLVASLARGDWLVSSRLGNQVLRYGDDATFKGVAAIGGGLFTPNGLAIGADGMLYVASRDGGQILRYSATTGAFDKVFASGPEMVGPSGITFGTDGDLYVANSLADNISRYDHLTGALVRTFGTGGELSAPVGIHFGIDSKLYVTSVLNNRLVSYDPNDVTTPQILASGGLIAAPAGFGVGTDGVLYLVCPNVSRIIRFDPASGTRSIFAQNAATIGAVDAQFGPEGDLYVCNFAGDVVSRVDRATGASKGAFIAAGGGGLDGPQFLIHVPEPGASILVLFIVAAGSGRRRACGRPSRT